jgi:MSHA biogenesis protein MshI
VIGFLRKQRGTRSIGLAVTRGSLTLAVLDQHNGQPRLHSLATQTLPPGGKRADSLRQLLRRHRSPAAPLRAVLDGNDYSLLQTEAPDVSPEELKSALRWSIKDMLDFHIDDAIIDAFELPRPARQGSPLLLSVVAARRSLIRELLDDCHAADLDPASIDIGELALRNLATLCDHGDQPIACLFLLPTQAVIEITRGDTLFLARRLPPALTGGSGSNGDGELTLEAYDDPLSLELQRSLDHFESHFGLGPARRLHVLGSGSRDIAERLRSGLFNIQVEQIDLTEHLPGSAEQPADLLDACLPAIGAALRH